jgi:hypothetical protein
MMSTTQEKISELVAEIERLTPLAEAERLAAIAGIEGIEDICVGCGMALDAAKAERDRLVDERQAALLAEEVQRYRDGCAQRDEAWAQLSKLDAEIAGFSEQERDLFRRANDMARWTDRAIGRFPQGPLSGVTFRDRFGNILDVSPIDAQQKKIVPDEHWPAVQLLRDLYVHRAILGQNLGSMDQSLRELTAKSPAPAHLKARHAVPA